LQIFSLIFTYYQATSVILKIIVDF